MMTAAVAPIAALLFSVALLLMGNGLQGVLLPVSGSLSGFSDLDLGVLGSAYYAGYLAGCLAGPYLVRRAGHIRTFAAMVSVVSSVVLAHSLIADAVVWWLLRAATGLCFAVLYTVIESWLNEKSTDSNRGFVFSIYTVINLVVITIGQLMLTLGEAEEFGLFALASILVSLAAVPVAMTRGPAPEPISSVEVSLVKLYRESPVGVAGCLAAGLANGAFWTLGPVYALDHGATTTGVAVFMSAAVIAGAVGQWPLGLWSDRTDRRKTIVAACAGAALAGLGLVVLAGTSGAMILVLAFAFGLFTFPVYPLSVAHANDYVPPTELVQLASGLILVFGIGAVLGPLASSVVMRFLGVEALFAFTAFVHIGAALFAAYRMQMREPAAEEDRGTFVDALRAAATVSTIDPLSSTGEEVEAEPLG